MKIAIRMDDITPDMDWERFLAIKEALDRRGIRPLIGVVPDNRDSNLKKGAPREDFWEYLQELQKQGWTVALHGYRHVYTTKKAGLFPLNRFSEFAGVPYERQRQMIESGTEILRQNGILTNIFMTPGHSYDKNTLRALRETGYTCVTDGFGSRPYLRAGLIFYPISFLMSRSLKKKNGATTMVLHANEMSDPQIRQFEEMVSNEANQFISYDEYLMMPVGKRRAAGNLAEYVMAAAKRVLVKARG